MSTFETWGVTLMVADESPSAQWAAEQTPTETSGEWRLIAFTAEQTGEWAKQMGVFPDEGPCGAILRETPTAGLIVAWFQVEADLLAAAWAEVKDPGTVDGAAAVFNAYREQMGFS